MLQMPAHPLLKATKSYAAFAGQYLPESEYQPVIAVEKQQAALKLLDAQPDKERFYVLIDVKSGTIIQCNGINRCLGFTDAHFTQKQYEQIMHPAHAVVQRFYAAALFELLIAGQVSATFMRSFCATTIALKNKQGKYVYCKRQCYTFQLNANNKVISYLCEFTVVKDFANEDYFLKLHDENSNKAAIKEQMKNLLVQKFETAAGFSVQELRILKRYAANETTNSDTIAKAFKIEKATVDTYNKRILKKTAELFFQRFENAKQAAGYFKRMLLI